MSALKALSSRLGQSQPLCWGVDVIGMTNLPEARLAREAELPYATLALVTDFDCWHQGHADVSVESVFKVIGQNVTTARAIIREAGILTNAAESPASTALKHV